LGIVLIAGGWRENGRLMKWQKLTYLAMAACIAVATFDLLYLFLAHKFQYSYVYGYSSRDLPLGYLISSVWAGQEGTFLLWAFFGALLGLFLLNRRGPLATRTMTFFLITQVFLLVLMLVKSPFEMLDLVPPDGRGLNPLLQDPWMVIHPPIIFIGYAALAIPFAHAMAAMIAREFENFAVTAFPWVAFSVASLGAGIFIGGFWAYKVLGWGGYWGWDPVENASLIPWLTSLALLHGLILFRMQPKLLKTNLGLAIISYLLVVYGTFLTRSGVLADFSVHSFADLGINAYLIIYMIGITVISLLILAVRTAKVPTIPISRAINSREFGLVFGLLLLVITAGLVLVGTSAPLLTRIGGQASNVTIDYYNSISLPLGILLVLTLTLSPFLIFGRTPWRDLLRQASPALFIACLATIGAVLLDVMQWEHLILVFGATGALVSNVIAMVRNSQGFVVRMGGHLTHVGFALMLIGILGSSGYGVSERLTLRPNQPKEAFGYDITFNRMVEGHKVNESYLDIALVKGSSRIEARPKIYFSDYTQSYMRNPHVIKGLLGDLYLAPLEHERDEHAGLITLRKGEPVSVGDWTLTFTSFRMGDHANAGSMLAEAMIDAVRGADTIQIAPAMESGRNGLNAVPMTIPGTDVGVSLERMQVEQQAIQLAFNDPDGPGAAADEYLALDVSTKPLVSWVWAGVVLLTIGSVLSFVRRWRETDVPA
jgi:cytochrome c-type biogenesis protein CcmF